MIYQKMTCLQSATIYKLWVSLLFDGRALMKCHEASQHTHTHTHTHTHPKENTAAAYTYSITSFKPFWIESTK